MDYSACECDFGSDVRDSTVRLRGPRPAALKCTVTFVTVGLVTSTLNLHPAMEVCSGDVSGGPPNMRMGRCVPGTFPEMAVNMWHESMISILIIACVLLITIEILAQNEVSKSHPC